MPILTATQVTIYTDLGVAASVIQNSGLISTVQERINFITNNYFTTELALQGTVTFNGTARTIVSANNWAEFGFADGDEIYIYHSYRNDGYYTVSSISTSTMTLVTGSAVVDELSGRSVLISVVKWPTDLVYAAAQMVAYDYSARKERTPGVTSRSLGPWSESYAQGGSGAFGYPDDLLAPLYDHRIARLM